MKIAIIDSGIDRNHKKLSSANIQGVSIKELEDNDFLIEEYFQDNLGHGTACASIIHKICPSAQLYAIKIFDNELFISEKVLCRAIRWCIDNDINILNLSLGIETNSSKEILYKICQEAYNKNIILIAAANNDLSKECYPAHFSTVFGVTSGSNKNINGYGYINNSNIEFVAKGTLQRVAWFNNGYNVVQGSSFACAHFTGIVANAIINSPDLTEIPVIKDYLIKNSNKEITPSQFYNVKNSFNLSLIDKKNIDEIAYNLFQSNKSLSWIKGISIFPASEKELSTLIKYKELLTFPIKNIIEFNRKSFNVFQEDISLKHIYKTIDEIEITSIDTLILGYFLDSLFEVNIQMGIDLIKNSLTANKNLFVLDKRLIKIINNIKSTFPSQSKVHLPIVNNKSLDNILHFKHLPDIKVPIIAVIGTSNKQGKFTTQLYIKNVLEQDGYKISFISTEPHGELFGADCAFPYGFGNNIEINQSKWGIYLRILVKGVQHYNSPQIILTGTQGWTIPRSPNQEPFENETKSLDYLFGIQPDALICAINPNDPIDIIENTILAAKIYTGAEVLFYTITPFERTIYQKGHEQIRNDNILNAEQLNDKINYYQDVLKKPVIDILNPNNNKMILNLIENFF